MARYIGARYVTKVYENSLDPSSAEWESGVTYEPLTMVTYNNGSYLSKKEVPGGVGDPASNSDYWTQTGFYNGQIAALQNDINDINASLNNSYAFIGNHSVSLTSDGVKTNRQLLSELATAAENYFATLPNDVFVRVNVMTIGNAPVLPRFSYGATNATTNPTYEGFVINVTDSAVFNRVCRITANAANCMYKEFYYSSNAIFTELANSVSPSGEQFSIRFDIYKNLNPSP